MSEKSEPVTMIFRVHSAVVAAPDFLRQYREAFPQGGFLLERDTEVPRISVFHLTVPIAEFPSLIDFLDEFSDKHGIGFDPNDLEEKFSLTELAYQRYVWLDPNRETHH